MVKRRTPARMARLVAQWRASGESGARFARRHHVSAWTFWYWRRKYSGDLEAGAADGPPTTFVPVRVTAESDASVVEVVLTGGERLLVRHGASSDLVRAVVAALRAGC